MSFPDRAVILTPGEGREVKVLGDRYTFKLVADQTGGAYGLVETGVSAGSAGPPPHIHHTEDEAFYVLEGEVEVLVGEQRLTGPQGSFVFVPRGTVHTFSNASQREARLLVILSPGGFEQAFAEMSQVAARADEPPDMERLMEIARRYNLEIVAPPGS